MCTCFATYERKKAPSLTSYSAVRDQHQVVLGRVVAGLHVVDLGVHADALAAVEGLKREKKRRK